MQFLRGPPGSPPAVFAEVFHHQPDVFQMANPGLRVAKPKTLRMPANQFGSAFNQLRWSWRRHGDSAEFIKLAAHAFRLGTRPPGRKAGVPGLVSHVGDSRKSVAAARWPCHRATFRF